jgi:hypothetical protein
MRFAVVYFNVLHLLEELRTSNKPVSVASLLVEIRIWNPPKTNEIFFLL